MLSLTDWVHDLSQQLPSNTFLKVDTAGEALEMRGDAVMLREALVNLMDNAVQHGGPDLSEIHVSLRADGPSAIIRVEDNGVGIAPEHRAAALERFTQIGSSNGSGLGLPIAKAVAVAHGGHLVLGESRWMGSPWSCICADSEENSQQCRVSGPDVHRLMPARSDPPQKHRDATT